MKRRRRLVVVRLGEGGDYRSPDLDLRARRAFLATTERLIPEAIAELKTVDAEDATAVEAWCRRRGFVAVQRVGSADWLREVARATAGGQSDHFLWTFPSEPPVMISWYPTREPEAQFDARVKRIKREVTQRLVPVTTIRVPRGTDPGRLFEWLVLYQVAGWSYADIAARHDPDEDAADDAPFVSPEAVKEAIHRLAPLVGIALRRGRRGRPKKGTPKP